MDAITQECIACTKTYPLDEVRYLCECGNILDISYDYECMKESISPTLFDSHNVRLWKYSSFLPVRNRVSLQEGGTSLYTCASLKERMGSNVYVKNEGENPTGSFKDRGMTIGVSKALELGYGRVACASTGNTSASLAAYAARAGITCFVFIPAGKIALGKLAQAYMYGGRVIPIAGNFDTALSMVIQFCREWGIYLLNSINPYRLEGQKTIAFELFDQLQYIPDRVVLPVGNAGNISAIWKGFCELKKTGITDSLPQMIGIQAEGAAPLVNYYRSKTEYRAETAPETVATAIRIGNPVSWKKAMRAITESRGKMESVTDKQILSAQRLLASKEGIFVEPASAAAVAGALQCAGGSCDGSVVIITTGHGLKDPDIVMNTMHIPQPFSTIDEIEDYLTREEGH
jgi:threonine synthase